MDELKRILANVQYMVGEGAPEADIETYLRTEGYTLQSLNAALAPKAPAQAAPFRLPESLQPNASAKGAIASGLIMAARGAAARGPADLMQYLSMVRPVAKPSLASRVAPGAARFLGNPFVRMLGAGAGGAGVGALYQAIRDARAYTESLNR